MPRRWRSTDGPSQASKLARALADARNRKRRRAVEICDSCRQAFYDEGADAGMLELGLLDMGADIPDHICDSTETDGEVECCCPCTSR